MGKDARRVVKDPKIRKLVQCRDYRLRSKEDTGMLKNSIILLDSSTLVSEALPLLFPLMHHTPLTIHLLRFVPRSGEPAGEDLSFLQEQAPALQIFERPCSTAREVLEQAAKVEAESIVVVAHDRNNLSGGAFGT